ncbi:NAD(+)/NADH kinase [Acidobacteriota bacterium]
MKETRKVGFVIKPHAPDIKGILTSLVTFFEKRGRECVFEEAAAVILDRTDGIVREQIPAEVDLVVVLGGDGTLLSIAYEAAQRNVPVLGVNLGSLGFLTEVPTGEMFESIDSFLEGDRTIVSPRLLLEVKSREKTYFCLNDVVINKGALARMIQCALLIDGLEIARLRSDGLIISTPTGSTAYSLAAGGPIVHPHIPAVVIAPICPHTLTFRPMVISSDSEICVQLLTEDEEVHFTLDGQRGGRMSQNETIAVKRSVHKLMLISSPKRNYFDLLHEKLGWG